MHPCKKYITLFNRKKDDNIVDIDPSSDHVKGVGRATQGIACASAMN